MNKKQVLATLALSTLALAQAGYVSADELALIDSSAPTTEVVTPTAPTLQQKQRLQQFSQQHLALQQKQKLSSSANRAFSYSS